jgi:hypothetical protein
MNALRPHTPLISWLTSSVRKSGGANVCRTNLDYLQRLQSPVTGYSNDRIQPPSTAID